MNAKVTLSSEQRRALLTHPAGWIACGFGSGLAPRAQGTLGSLVAIIPWWFLWRDLGAPAYGLMLVLAFALGVWACGESGRRIAFSDHRALVWDEFVGQWITLWPAVFAPWWAIVAGFVLFRLFDVAKPWPVGWLDKHVKGGAGVMLDDVAAGIVGGVVLVVILYFTGHLQAA
ncbi:MAG TPA: phosphatidylglycerophosphatase A [Rhodanobacteraceae bacterium]